MHHVAFANGISVSLRGHHHNFLACNQSVCYIIPRRYASKTYHRQTPVSLLSVDEGKSESLIEPRGQTRYFSEDGLGFKERSDLLMKQGVIPKSVIYTLQHWCESYLKAMDQNPRILTDSTTYTEEMFSTLLELVRRVVQEPIQFQSYHSKIREPFDLYKFGLDFSDMLLNYDESQVLGRDNIRLAEQYAKEGHNVIFLSNHQSEGDPYAIDVLLDVIVGCDREFCENIIFMAGDRVTNDPVVSPFSAGRNLLTVYSKKHINDIPDLKEEKLLHNRRTISETQKLFKKGGQVVWFAPSGGRDRRSEKTSRVEISPFDEGAVDMMKFTAMKSGKPFHFFPMTLWTYEMLPPPSNVGGADLGEKRIVNYGPMHMSVGKEIDWNQSVPSSITDKRERRRIQCQFIEKQIIEGYKSIGGYNN